MQPRRGAGETTTKVEGLGSDETRLRLPRTQLTRWAYPLWSRKKRASEADHAAAVARAFEVGPSKGRGRKRNAHGRRENNSREGTRPEPNKHEKPTIAKHSIFQDESH